MIISSDIQFDKVGSIQIGSILIHFDPFWSILIHFDPFWQMWLNLKLKIWWYISMVISSEIENVEKVENLIKTGGKCHKSILRAFARTRAKKSIVCVNIQFFMENMKMKRKRDKKIWPSTTGIWTPIFEKVPAHNLNFEGD
jgi:hypothetical protein